jgi:hypothetical protein
MRGPDAGAKMFILGLDVQPEGDFIRLEDFSFYQAKPAPVHISKIGPQLVIGYQGESPGEDDHRLSELVVSGTQWAASCLGTLAVLIPGYHWWHNTPRNLLELPHVVEAGNPLLVHQLYRNRFPRTRAAGLASRVNPFLAAASHDTGLFRGVISLSRASSVPDEAPFFLYRPVEAAVRSAAGGGSSTKWEAGYRALRIDQKQAQRLMNKAQEWRHPGDFNKPIAADPPFEAPLRLMARRALARLAKLRDPAIAEPKNLL